MQCILLTKLLISQAMHFANKTAFITNDLLTCRMIIWMKRFFLRNWDLNLSQGMALTAVGILICTPCLVCYRWVIFIPQFPQTHSWVLLSDVNLFSSLWSERFLLYATGNISNFSLNVWTDSLHLNHMLRYLSWSLFFSQQRRRAAHLCII